MLGILLVVLPVFLVIAAGYAAVRLRVLPETGVDALLQFTTRIAVPALLFSKMLTLDLSAAFEPAMILSFYAGAFAVFAIAALAARRLGRTGPEAVSIGFTAYFSNTLLLGVPIMERAYGQAALEPAFGLIAFHAPLLFTIGMIAIEISRRPAEGLEGAGDALRRAAASIARNALMIGIFSGLTLNVLGAPLPAFAVEGVDLLASAALPTALFTLGAALTRYSVEKDVSWALGVSILALAAHPAIAFGLGAVVFSLAPEHLRAATLMAAMPCGLNTYVFAAMHREAESVSASAVVLSTALAIVSVSLWLALLGGAASPI